MIKRISVLTALTVLLFAAVAIGNANASSTKRAIAAANDNFMATYSRGDAPGMACALTPRAARFYPPTGIS